MTQQEIIAQIRDVKDFPVKGIVFKDLTTVFDKPECLRWMRDEIVNLYRAYGITKVVGIESRGFIFGAPLACRLGAGFIPIRKPNKLPADTIKESYSLEYGTDTIEMHADAVKSGDRVLVIDDLLATGGTAVAACNLVKKAAGMCQGGGGGRPDMAQAGGKDVAAIDGMLAQVQTMLG